MKRFEDKVVIITGGSSGFGLETAKMVAAEGGKVTIVARNEEKLERAKKEIEETVEGAEVLALSADVSDEEAVQGFVEQTVQVFGKVNALFNNAGVGDGIPNIEDITEEHIDTIFGVNYKAAVFGIKHVLPYLREEGGGRIVNTSSGTSLRVTGGGSLATYSASKAALNSFTKQAAYQYGKENIQVNAVAPGWVLTEIVNKGDKSKSEELEEKLSFGNPMGRTGEVREVAEVAAFLLSDASPYLNGEVIAVDGGHTI